MEPIEREVTTLDQSKALHDSGIDEKTLLYWCMYDETLIPVAEYNFAWKTASPSVDCYKAYGLGQLMNILFKVKPKNCSINIARTINEKDTPNRWDLNADINGEEYYIFRSPSLIECFVEAILKLK